MNSWETVVKRLMDVIISSTALLLLSPFLLLIGLAIRITSSGPLIFRQQRLGKGGVPFTMYKFRTMVQGAHLLDQRTDDGGSIMRRDDPRVTRIGRYLRTMSLDELPQLWNVLIGEMSLVGPRPDRLGDIEKHYTQRDMIKLSVKPGLTGLAMVNGRNSIPWRERMKWDIKYASKPSLVLDLSIILRTIPVLLFRQGIYTTYKDNQCIASKNGN
jgi:lipopolysaccharide/colanic/teichoic acid biosynthesis glycosyltransferase